MHVDSRMSRCPYAGWDCQRRRGGQGSLPQSFSHRKTNQNNGKVLESTQLKFEAKSQIKET